MRSGFAEIEDADAFFDKKLRRLEEPRGLYLRLSLLTGIISFFWFREGDRLKFRK